MNVETGIQRENHVQVGRYGNGGVGMIVVLFGFFNEKKKLER